MFSSYRALICKELKETRLASLVNSYFIDKGTINREAGGGGGREEQIKDKEEQIH